MKNKIFLIILLFVSISYNTNAQADTKTDSTENIQYSELKLFPLKYGKIRQMPFKTVNSLSMLNPSAYYLKGDCMFYYGIEANGDYIFIDGMQVNDGNEFPFRSIGSYNFYGLSSPIYMGNSAAGFINIQSLEVEDKLTFNIEVNKDLKKYYNDYLVEFNLGMPINFSKNKTKKINPSVFIAGSYYNTNNTDPVWEDSYIIKPGVLEYLKNNPLRPSGLVTGGTFQNAEYVRDDDIMTCQSPQNAEKNAWNSFAKIQIPFTNNIELTLGNYTKIENSDQLIFDNALFNSFNNPERNIRNIDNYLKFEHKIKISEDLNIGYQVHLQYSNYYTKLQSSKHKDRFFEYGYLGKFQTYKTPSFQIGDIQIDSTYYQNVWLLNSWDYDTAYTFRNLNYNPEAARFTEQIYELYPDPCDHWMNSTELQLNGGLLNGHNPPTVYGLWNSQGKQYPYYIESSNNNLTGNFNYMENAEEKIRGTLGFTVDYKSHHFTAGFEYMKEIKRFYSINPMGLWTIIRGLTNFHILELDMDNPIPVYDHGVFQNTVLFYRNYDALSQKTFDINLRKKLGLAVDGVNFILTDSYDMVNRTIDYYDKNGEMHTIQLTDKLYSLDMFSPDELLKHGTYIQYQGYGYTGNKIKNKQDHYDFFTNRTIDAFRPLYLSGYLNDRFSWKNINVSIGLKIDRYDANQPVLKDKYSLMEIYDAGDLRENDGNWSIPENIGDDYAVYVDDFYYPNLITGYRDNDTWYNKDGNEISDPSFLDAGSGINPYLKNPGLWLGESGWEPDMTFKNYEPVVNLLPQINIDFTLSDITNIYFSYNTYSQNPNYYNQFRPDKYWLFDYNNPNELFPNPDLKPLRMEKLNIGIKRPIYKRIFADVGFLMTFLKNNYYIDKIIGAYPHDYYTVLNDNNTIITKGLIASLNYFSPKASGLNFTVSVTKLFPDEEDFNYTEISDLIVNSFAGFNFGTGKDYIGPVAGNWKVLEEFGLSFYYQFRKGTPYSTSYYGDSFKHTPNFNMLNMKLEQGFYLKNRMGINIYLLIENLFNFKNVFYVYPSTGESDDDGFLTNPENQAFINNQLDPESYRTLYKIKLLNPQHYDIPRIIRLGCILHF